MVLWRWVRVERAGSVITVEHVACSLPCGNTRTDSAAAPAHGTRGTGVCSRRGRDSKRCEGAALCRRARQQLDRAPDIDGGRAGHSLAGVSARAWLDGARSCGRGAGERERDFHSRARPHGWHQRPWPCLTGNNLHPSTNRRPTAVLGGVTPPFGGGQGGVSRASRASQRQRRGRGLLLSAGPPPALPQP
jgi:hypothetical protein